MNPQEHKSALRRLNAISKLLDLNKFFTASINRWGKVNLQGDFDKKIVKWAIEHKFEISANKTLGYVTLTRVNIEINLI
jgi:hypothetical protein